MWRGILGTAGRLILAGVLLWAGGAKLGDLGASVRAVNAYQLMPYELARVIGAALPLVEVALGLLLLVGLATRVVAAATAVLMAVFIAGIASAWARGLNIDCGCFGGGGELAAGVRPSYGWEIARDVALLAIAVALVVWPRSALSVDGWIAGPAPAGPAVAGPAVAGPAVGGPAAAQPVTGGTDEDE